MAGKSKDATRNPLDVWPYSVTIDPLPPILSDPSFGSGKCVPIPAEYVTYIVSALQAFVWPDAFNGTDEERETSVTNIETLIDQLLSSAYDCAPTPGGCHEYPPHAGLISYFPDNPYNPSGEPPGGYLSRVWRVGNDDWPYSQFFGLNDTDVWCQPELDLDILQVVYGVLTLNLPRIDIEIEGTGSLEIDFIEVPQGGYAIIIVDDDLLNPVTVDLQSINLISLLDQTIDTLIGAAFGGLFPIRIVELPIESAGMHNVKIYFLPSIQFLENPIDIFQIGFGGGIRSIEWCSETQPIDIDPPDCQEPETIKEYELVRLRQSPTNQCVLEQFDPESATWDIAFDFTQCDLFSNLTGNNITIDWHITIITLQQFQTEVGIYLGDTLTYPPQVAVNAEDQSDINALLCFAISRYWSVTLDTILDDRERARDGNILAGTVIALLVATGFGVVPLVLGGIIAGIAAATLDDLDDATDEELSDPVARGRVFCYAYNQMKASTINQTRYSESLDDHPYPVGSPERKIVNVLQPIIATDEHYVGFLNLLKEYIPLIEILGNDCDGCEIALDPCAAFNHNWTIVQETPSDFHGELFDWDTTQYQGDLVRGDGQNWTDPAPWQPIRAVWTPVEPCIPGAVTMGFQRSTTNQASAYIHVKIGGVWIIGANLYVPVGGSPGAYEITWDNTSGATVEAVRFAGRSAQFAIYRCKVS